MDRREFVKLVFGAGVGIAVGGCGGAGARMKGKSGRPNVVVILADDQGYGDLGVTGNSNLSTPNIDSIAKDGACFDRFYVCPVCAPTRAEFLTGRYHLRSRVYGVSQGLERMDLDEVTIGDTFKAAGYSTGAFGKWHNGMQYPYHPNGRGFEEYYGFCSGHWGNYFSPMLEHNGRIVKGEGFVIDDFTNKAMAFMEDSLRAGKPFFAYLPYNTPHSPMQVPDKFWAKFKDKEIGMRHRDEGKEKLDMTRAALAMCENIDWNVGRVLRKLEDLGISDDTIVVYFSDNGPNSWRWNDGMKGKKGSTDEGGVRSPMLIRWRGKIAEGMKVERIAGAIDLLPSLAELAGVELIGEKPLDGVSLKPLLVGEGSQWDERMIFTHWGKRISVRTQRYRLDNQGKLFDMVKDPGQREDVSEKVPDVAGELRAAVKEWKKEMLPGEVVDDRAFVIGHPDFRFTQIPARDGVGHGEIKQSCRHPNCSYYENWVNVEDYISWDVEVAAGGEFDVDIYYTCAKEDVGAVVELSFNGTSVRKKITEAHDPALFGAEMDRVKRIESYVKDFKALRMGRIRLEKGNGELILRAVEKPGREVMDFRLMMLARCSS